MVQYSLNKQVLPDNTIPVGYFTTQICINQLHLSLLI